MDAEPQVERDIALDLVKHGLLLAPVVVLVAGIVSGWDGTASAAIAFGVLGVVGIAARSYLWYRAANEREEKGKPWKRNLR